MGTRADFYIGRGESAEWLGSIAWDGYPSGIDNTIKQATTEDEYRHAVSAFLASRDDATLPERGWPWPWDDSNTTDYSYAFDDMVYGTCFGYGWWPVNEKPDDRPQEQKVIFPDMADRKKVRWDQGSGLILLRG